MDRENLFKRSGQSGESESVEIRVVDNDEKIDVEIREIIRIKPQDFAGLKNSFEHWADQWQ